MRRLTCPLTLVWILTAASAPAFAEWNPAPIAVPLLNAETAVSSPGALHPSTITVAPPGGANHVAFISVTLHAVTHPCPDDLGVLLVRGTEKYLLMSNAGGCRPLQGTDIKITSFPAGPLLDNDAGPPYGAPWRSRRRTMRPRRSFRRPRRPARIRQASRRMSP